MTATSPRPGEVADPVSPPDRRWSSKCSTGLSTTAGVAVLGLTIVAAVSIGANGVGLPEVVRTVGVHLGLPVQPLPGLLDALVWALRIPRVLLAALVGAMLAVSGALLQGLTGNSLADPYLLGVSNGASAGAVTVVVLGLGGSAVGLASGALLGSLTSFGLMMVLLRGGMQTIRIVLTGVVVGQLFAAVTSLVITTSADSETTRAITYWLLGSLASARWESVTICAVVGLLGLIVCWLRSQALDAFAFGVDTAESLGISVRRTRITVLVVTAFLTSVAVASVGAIGFVGLIVPHAARFVVGPLHRALLPFTAVGGAVFLVWTDAVSRIVFAPREVPVGVFTAIIGVPLFLLIMRRRGEL